MSAALAYPGDDPDLPGGHAAVDPHTSDTPGDPSNLNGHLDGDAHVPTAVEVSTPPPGHAPGGTPIKAAGRGPFLSDPFLGLLAETVNDLEGVRKATANRFRQLTRSEDELDKDGEGRGLGLPLHAPEVKVVHDLLVLIGGEKVEKDGSLTHGGGGVEHQAVLALQRQVRKHSLWTTWGVDQKGVGEKQFARLLASVGDPYWNDLHHRPRTVSELWAYCGFHVVHTPGHGTGDTHARRAGGVAPKRVKGTKVNWNGDARMRVWNISGSCLKARDLYADVYHEAKAKYVDSVHNAVCPQCGPKGKPALAGSPLSDGHKHARGLRIMSKEILRDLWLAAKALHEADPEPPLLAKSEPMPNAGAPVGD